MAESEEVKYMIELPLLATGLINGIYTDGEKIYLLTTEPLLAQEYIPSNISGFDVEIIKVSELRAW